VMIEVPAAALRAARFLDVVDFLSIGTNDLSQYTLAADRQSGGLADLLDPWQPALLELIGRCAAAGKASGRSVGVCGEAAADPLLAPVLAGLGITKLSMSPRALPAVRASLAERTLADCERLAARALETDDAAGARAAVLAQTT
jgi:phosphoenolpyruvate-protein phosphotransferase (PTS system enzyme I)